MTSVVWWAKFVTLITEHASRVHLRLVILVVRLRRGVLAAGVLSYQHSSRCASTPHADAAFNAVYPASSVWVAAAFLIPYVARQIVGAGMSAAALLKYALLEDVGGGSLPAFSRHRHLQRLSEHHRRLALQTLPKQIP